MALSTIMMLLASAFFIGLVVGRSHHWDRLDLLYGGTRRNASYPRIRHAGRIVNGRKVPIQTFPFIVSIQKKSYVWRHHCGGSIVNPTLILTACHCVVQQQKIVGRHWRALDPTWMRIVAGTSDWSARTPLTQISKISKVTAHPGCSNHATANGIYKNDVGVLVLQTPLTYSNTVQPMKVVSNDVLTALSDFSRLVKTGAICYTPGWGLTSENTRTPSKVLNVAAVQLMTTQQCRARFCALAGLHCRTDFSSIHQVCVMSPDSSDCYGDSGGPLVFNGYVYGTVSYGHHCYPGWPTVFQNLQPALEIIGYAKTLAEQVVSREGARYYLYYKGHRGRARASASMEPDENMDPRTTKLPISYYNETMDPRTSEPPSVLDKFREIPFKHNPELGRRLTKHQEKMVYPN